MLKPDSVLQNRYQLKQILHQKPGHQTWLSKDSQTDDLVVLKLLTLSDQTQWQDLQLFEREATVLQYLNHPQIPRYRDSFSIDDRLLWFGLVQDYVPGLSLKQLLEQGRLFDESQVRQIATDVLHVLVYLHQLSPPVLHRDIKPSNLILGDDSRIYVIDFGAVQAHAAKEGATFTVVGTYGYAPPEQLGGRAVPASDLYGLGTTLVHLLAGIAPADLSQANFRPQFADLVNLNPGFVCWLKRLIEPNLNQRFNSARQALAVLEAYERAIATLSPIPQNSRIEVYKSLEHLAILIPGEKPSKLAFILLGCALGSGLIYLLSRFSSPYTDSLGLQVFRVVTATLVLIGVSLIGLPKLAKIRILFTYRHFTIESRLFGICLKRHQGNIFEIDRVSSNRSLGITQNVTKLPDLLLSVGIQEYWLSTYGRTLTEVEYDWLVLVINQWLGLKEEIRTNQPGA
jgi:serine/threonine protein kinase